MGVLRWSSLALVFSVMSCAALFGIEDPVVEHASEADGGERDAPELSPDADAAVDGATADASRDGAEVVPPVTFDTAGCPSGRGPSMIASGPLVGLAAGFCIDRTEVAFAQWGMFRRSVEPATQTADCTWNTSFAVGRGAAANSPVTEVNWCDAKAFCRWAGKRLCGALGGGPGGGRWISACTNSGTTTYPYAGPYRADRCNTVGTAVVPVGSLAECTTTRGVVDLVGNVWEWVDQRTAQDAGPSGDFAAFLGGSFGSPGTYDCNTESGIGISARNLDVGFRCCADL